MSRYLAASIGLADGRILRIGPDEDQVGDIPLSFTFQTQIPGGFGPASLTIPRPPDLYADDARLFSDVVVYGEGMKIIYEGYVTGLPQQSQDEVQMQLAGWSTVLDRIANFRQMFVNRDLSTWQQPSSGRKLRELNAGKVALQGPSIGVDTQGRPILTLSSEGGSSGGAVGAEAWFDVGPGLGITKLFFAEASGNFGIGSNLYVGFTNNEIDGAPGPSDVRPEREIQIGGFYNPTDNRSNQTIIPVTQTRYVYFRHESSPEVSGYQGIRGIALYGNHNAPLVGANPGGVYGSDAIAYMIGPTPLNMLPDSIERSDFPIPHLSFLSDISLREAIEQINVLGGKERVPNDWGVYEAREFFWRSPGSYGKTWIVNQSNLTQSRSDGPDSVLKTAGVKVNYQDEAGVTKSVGPPNSFSDFETNTLLAIDEENPAYRIPGFHTESVGLTSLEGAVNIGQVILNERNRLNWRGDIELQGDVLDSEGKSHPVHRVRAGDQVIVQDDDDLRPRPINSTSYSHDNLSLTASLGAVPDSLDSLLARLAAVTDLFV